MLKPAFRFKEFKGDYESYSLTEIVQRVTRKNSNNTTNIPLTISSIEGLIDQRTYFGRAVASKDLSGYYLLKKGEFAYNKSYSKGYPVGSIKRLENYADGALSTLYICFSIIDDSDIDSDYLTQYFNSSLWHKAVKEICAEGARNHGLLNVSTNDFFSTIHQFAPTKPEQRKVADFLMKYDELILIQMQKVKSLQKRREGIIQKIFSRDIRFKSSDGTHYPDWQETYLSDILVERKSKSSGSEEVHSVSVSKGIINQIEHLGRSYAADDTSKYKVVVPGDMVYTKSPTGEFKWGIVKQSMIDKTVIVSPLYGVFIPLNAEIGFVLDTYFSSSVRAHNYLITQVTKGAKNTINVTNDDFLNNYIILPTSHEEAQKIKELVTLMNQQISLEKEKLESMKKLKKGLLQNMFV